MFSRITLNISRIGHSRQVMRVLSLNATRISLTPIIDIMSVKRRRFHRMNPGGTE